MKLDNMPRMVSFRFGLPYEDQPHYVYDLPLSCSKCEMWEACIDYGDLDCGADEDGYLTRGRWVPRPPEIRDFLEIKGVAVSYASAASTVNAFVRSVLKAFPGFDFSGYRLDVNAYTPESFEL